jgi:SAM-dependent methyltransferase
MASPNTSQLRDELRHYGIPPDSAGVKFFSDGARPELIEYLDLVRPRQEGEFIPDGVAESQGKPLLYFVDDCRLALPLPQRNDQLQRLRRVLGCRGQRSYLAVIKPGRLELEVFPVSLSKEVLTPKVFHAKSGEAITFFSRLALGHYEMPGEPAHADYAFIEMRKLLTQACGQLADPGHGLAKDDVLSLVGRALFFRFLVDRRIVKAADIEGIAHGVISPEACFSTPEHACATSHWLDKTFNGDPLPLTDHGSLAFFEQSGRQTKGEVFHHLDAIMQRHQAVGGRTYQRLLWSDFDFAHVPVGLLSQVYEAFCWKWEPYSAGSTSVYYTPRNIASTLVGEVFDGLQDAHKARVLDPACGGGVFLVLAFRRLYQELWRATGTPPDTCAIRRIMAERQLTGFDISEPALRLAALSLYLTAIELDPDPVPPQKLEFAKLRGNVLFNWRQSADPQHRADPQHGPVIGSLGQHVPRAQFKGKFDIVVSNPPWTRLREKDERLEEELRAVGWQEPCDGAEAYLAELAERFTLLSREVISRRGEPGLAGEYENPNKVPDLPMLWKSTEWCKQGGRIAMALPARILLKKEKVPRRAREALLKLVEVTGIVNGSNLTDTPVWPGMSEPFILLFARNRRPQAGHTIKFISPHCDVLLNRRGEVRIDSRSVCSVEVEAASEEPWLWKALAIGTALDAEVVRKVMAAKGRRIKDYWRRDLRLSSCRGYQINPKNPRQEPAGFLPDLPVVTAEYAGRFLVDVSCLPRFRDAYPGRTTAERPRKREVYRAPLVLLKQSPGEDRKDGWALLCLNDVAFSRDFYGYSGAAHDSGDDLARYLFLFLHSVVWIHYLLATGPVFAAERRLVYKADLDKCPIVPFERLSTEQRQTVRNLSQRLSLGDIRVFPAIDSLFASLYGLDEIDIEVIRDTLEVCLPYDQSRRRACQVPNGREQERFRRRLQCLLRPFFEVVGQEAEITPWRPEGVNAATDLAFSILLVGKRGQPMAKPDEFFTEKVVPLANETGASQIIQDMEGGLLVAILNQYRYWTPSRARLLAAEILRNHMGPFEG